MKRFLSVILTVIMMVSLAPFAFAFDYNGVDNTFSNFVPDVGKKAPNNWYDPYCYDSEGHIKADALYYEKDDAMYCNECHKIFSRLPVAKDKDGHNYIPYQTTWTDIEGKYLAVGESVNISYCPYCGKKITPWLESGEKSHQQIDGVLYGSYCTKCHAFNANYNTIMDSDGTYFRGQHCSYCDKAYTPESYIRFITSEQYYSNYSFIFSETAYKYGDGVDRSIKELTRSKEGYKFISNSLNYQDDNEVKPDADIAPTNRIQNMFYDILQLICNSFNWIKKVF